MSFKRSSRGFALFVCLLAGAAATPGLAQYSTGVPPPAKFQSGNMIAAMRLDYANDGTYWLAVDYHYAGAPAGARLVVKQYATREHEYISPVAYTVAEVPLVEGPQTVRLRMRRPADRVNRVTQRVVAEIVDPRQTVLANSTLKPSIEWDELEAIDVRPPVPALVQLQQAIDLIDNAGTSALQQAKTLLERALATDPKLDQAYIELARVAMKSKMGPAGLREAEALIKSAQQLRPDSVNAKILLGYVYVNQNRDKEGLALYEEAARAGTTNLWLWTNWGELLQKQGKYEAAVEKFRQVTAHPPRNDANDRARHQAYFGLLEVYRAQANVEAVEALYKQRWEDYPGYICYGTAYAHFMVSGRGNAPAADAIIKTLPPGTCETGEGRVLLTLVRYVTWAGAKQGERDEALRAARVAMPVGPQLFRLLAKSDHTVIAARQLVASGEKIDMQDNDRMDALGLALTEGDIAAARRLIAIGARPDALVGPDKMPVALLPVLTGDLAGIALMQRSGINYSQLRYRGSTAIDWARQQGDENVLKALRPGGKQL